MLARILFNLTLFASIGIGIFVGIKYGANYFLPVAMVVFFSGMLVAFIIGMISGASRERNSLDW